MMDMEDQFKDTYSVNYEEVIKSKDTSSVTKMLAMELMQNPYMPIREWFEGLSDTDLTMLMDSPDRDDYSDLILISNMLATAEGLDAGVSFEVMHDRMDMLHKLLIIESLDRKGLVKFFRENASFGEDMGSKIIVEKI